MFKFSMGIEVKSNVSGFQGVITSRAEHLNGCNRYWIQPKVGKDKKHPDGIWLDEIELVPLKTKALKHNEVKTGGFPSIEK